MTSSSRSFEKYRHADLMIEAIRLGHHTLLHNRASNAIILARQFGERPLKDVFIELQHAEVSVLEIWEKAGLFDLGIYQPEQIVARKDSKPKQTYLFQSVGGGIALRLEDETLGRQICCILERYICWTGSAPQRTLVVESEEDSFTVFENDVPVTERHGRDEIRFFLIRSICETILDRASVAATLHGSAVSVHDKALLLIGTSGSGKTTTALGLLQNGATQLADDHIALHSDGRSVLAFPTAIGMKPGSLSLREAQGLSGTTSCDASVRSGVRYVTAPLSATPGDRFPVSAAIFPDHQPGAAFAMERLSPEEAFVMSIDSGGRIARHFSSAAPLANFFNTIPAYRMTYANSCQVTPALKAITDP